MSSPAVQAWNATVGGMASSAEASSLSLILSLTYFASIILLGVWLMRGLFDAYKEGQINQKGMMMYFVRYMFMLLFTCYIFVI
ncbi:DUF3262 family protein [Vibrio sp. S11_S32]|uniref:DUF3262 family protein n=1 Tax=Vibrio sp. S11_S32 TaxID=2720225 RepID=UPI001681192D|nr:DUF3262 family protein [Vibrio sp. S11_S32]MBD1577101.1 DUF3262 family protein [Vibrio sp. S11_S32]